MTKQDYYKVLGLSKGASIDEIKKAYRTLAMKYHPDRNANDKELEKKFKEINEAYDVLKDDQKRAAYDSYGHAASSSGHGHSSSSFEFDFNFEDIFDLFGGGKKQKTQRRTKGIDLQYNMPISLEEAFRGAVKDISYQSEGKCNDCGGFGSKSKSSTKCTHCNGTGAITARQGFFSVQSTCVYCGGMGQVIKDPCTTCKGEGRLKTKKSLSISIPPGIEDGMRLRKVGEGDAAQRGGVNGDLYILISIKPHSVFKVDNNANLHCVLPIHFTTAVLGGEVEMSDIEGNKINITIPKGCKHGEAISTKNRGMTISGSKNRGNLVTHVNVEIPQTLTKKQKELIEELDKEFRESNEGLLNKVKNLWK